MAWNDKYILSYYSKSNQQIALKIKENATVTATYLKGRGEEPVIVNRKKDSAICVSNCEIGLIANSIGDLDVLYTNDPLKYKVEVTVNGVLYWKGYLDTELYNIPFVRPFNSEYSFQAVDPLTLLSRFEFVDRSGSIPVNYTGLKSYKELIQLALQAVGAEVSYIYVMVSTVGSQTSQSGGTSFLHNHYAICENFVDNKDKPYKWSKVIEGILSPWDLKMEYYKGDVYIYDLSTLIRGTYSWKKYDGSFNYISSTDTNPYYGTINSLLPSDLRVTKIPGVQKATVRSSIYLENKLIAYQTSADSVGNQTGYNDHTGNADYAWREYFYGQDSQMPGYYCFVSRYKGIGNLNNTVEEYRLSLWQAQFGNYNTAFSYYKPKFLLNQNNIARYGLRLKVKAKFRTKDYPDNPSESSSNKVFRAYLFCQLKIGNKQAYNNPSVITFGPSATSWVAAGTPTINNTFAIKFHGTRNDDNVSNIEDKWIVNGEFRNGMEWVEGQIIPLTGELVGNLEFNFLTRAIILDKASGDMSMYVDGLYIQSVSLEIVEMGTLNSVSESDIEYTGEIDTNWKNEGETVELIQGTNLLYHPYSKGSIVCYNDSNYLYDELFYRYYSGGGSTFTEKVLLNTMISNLKDPTIELSGGFNVPSSMIGYFTHTYFSGKKFVLKDCSEYLRIERMEGTFIERKLEELNVV